jgi:flagellar motor switch protein FliN
MEISMNDARPRVLDQLPPVEPRLQPAAAGGLQHSALFKIPVTVQVILGQVRMPLSEVMALGAGSVVMLDAELSQPVALLVNGNEVARGLIMVADEKTGQLAISLTSVTEGQAAP